MGGRVNVVSFDEKLQVFPIPCIFGPTGVPDKEGKNWSCHPSLLSIRTPLKRCRCFRAPIIGSGIDDIGYDTLCQEDYDSTFHHNQS